MALTDSRTGAPLYPSLDDVLPRRPVRYSALGEFSVRGTHLVVGARDPGFILAILNTLAFTLITISFEVTLGTLLALLLQRRFRGRGALRGLCSFPGRFRPSSRPAWHRCSRPRGPAFST